MDSKNNDNIKNAYSVTLGHDYVIEFGKYKGSTASYIFENDKPYTAWILKQKSNYITSNMMYIQQSLELVAKCNFALYQNSDIDRSIAFEEYNSNLAMSFGKHKGKTIQQIFDNHRDYFNWMKYLNPIDNYETWVKIKANISHIESVSNENNNIKELFDERKKLSDIASSLNININNVTTGIISLIKNGHIINSGEIRKQLQVDKSSLNLSGDKSNKLKEKLMKGGYSIEEIKKKFTSIDYHKIKILLSLYKDSKVSKD
jgi:hypothetical protein